MTDLVGRRVVVVGASAGIGRAFASHAVRAGADVVLAARRATVLAEAIEEAGGGSAATVDVCDERSRRALVEHLAGGPAVDLVFVSAGIADLKPLAVTDDATWAATFATNLIGIARLVDELRRVLSESAVVAILSSETSREPRRGLVPYAASKAALEVMVAGLRVEHPGLRASCAIVGATQPTEFGARFDMEHLVPALEEWTRRGQLPEVYMDTDEVASFLLDVYSAALRHPGVGIEDVVVRPPGPPSAPPPG